MALDPTHYCYCCGEKHTGTVLCQSCGAETNPSEDTYFTHEECLACGREVPRWAHFCPYCGGKQEKNDDAGYPAQWRSYRIKLLITNLVWSAAVFLAVFVLPGRLEWLTLPVSLVAGVVLLVIIWGTMVVSSRKGRYWDGTVTALTTEPGTQKVCVDAGTFQDVPCTIYKTEIRWDNGKTLTRSQKANRADHEQLKVGDRVRLYDGINRFAKL